MPIQPTEQQTMVLTRTTKGNSDCADFDIVTSQLLLHFRHIVAIASSAQIPRQEHPTVRIGFCSYRRVAITAVSFTTIPPGSLRWKSWIQNVHSTLYIGLFSCTNCRVASIRIHNSTRHFHVMAFSHGQSFLLC